MLLLLLIVTIAGLAWFLVGDQFNLETLQARRGELAAAVSDRPIVSAVSYFLLYVAMTALSIPGAAVLTLGGGALFGLLIGTILVSFASTAGASLAFLGSRYLFRSWVERRYGPRLESVNRGIEKDGALYLLSLRLNPVVPFFLINLAMGLTRMRLWRFALISQLGMLPATVIYVNAGTQLASLRSLSGIATPSVLGSLLALSLLPLFGRFAAARLRRRGLSRRWKKPRRFDRNLIVVGAGSGGLVTSYIAAASGAKVTLIEAREMGGDCLNTGCVPSKTLIRSARAAFEINDAKRFGIAAGAAQADFPAVMERVRDAIRAIAPHDSVERYRSLGVDVRIGTARIVDPWTVEVEGERLTARSIVLATGAEPGVPPIQGIESSGYVTSETLWERLSQLEEVPPRVIVLGGGPIGVEMAQALARLGSQVTIVQSAERLLARETPAAAKAVAKMLAGEGVAIRLETEAVRCEAGSLVIRTDEGAETLAFDLLLVAVGRKPRLTGFGLEELGLDVENLKPDPWLATEIPSILLAGDAAGGLQFTHAASHSAWHAAINSLFGSVKRFRHDDSLVPRVTFTDPELASIGLDAESAKAAGLEPEIVRRDFADHDRAITDGATTGFLELVVGRKGKILGATIFGAHAGETIALVALAMRANLPLGRLLATVLPYPTMAEAVKLAAGDWRRRHLPARALRLASAWHRWRRG